MAAQNVGVRTRLCSRLSVAALKFSLEIRWQGLQQLPVLLLQG